MVKTSCIKLYSSQTDLKVVVFAEENDNSLQYGTGGQRKTNAASRDDHVLAEHTAGMLPTQHN